MQNSVTMGLRAIVLLVCLVGVPLFAVFGKNAPDVVKALIRNFATGAVASDASDAGSADSTSFRPGLVAAHDRVSNDTRSNLPTNSTGAAPRPLVAVADAPPLAHAAKAIDSIPQSSTLPSKNAPPISRPIVHPVGAAIDQREPAGAAALHIDAGRPGGTVPAAEKPIGELSAARTGVSSFPSDYFRGAEQKLRQLGATYYLLETLGPAGDSYRFFCKVAVSQNPDQVLAFFATSPDPLAAMDDVVRQVEAWRVHLRQ